MTVRVAYVTTCRSDYGPSRSLLEDLFRDPRFEPLLLVGGAHLNERQGLTVREIEDDGFLLAARIPFLDTDESAVGLARAAGNAQGDFAALFDRMRPDVVILYGDRYELLAAAAAAMITRIPIAHVCGGDLTVGAIDDQVRHALTKIAHLHFPSTERSADRIRQMGEEAWRIHRVGDPALDAFRRGPRASGAELTKVLGFAPDRSTLVVTYHPPTLNLEDGFREAEEVLAALSEHAGPIVLTGPAPDPGAPPLRERMLAFAASRTRTVFVESLGGARYRGLLAEAGAMVGNSSSGLIEAPAVALPVVNIGRRQDGRERGPNVIDAPPVRDAVLVAIGRALEPGFRALLDPRQNPYGDGLASGRVLEVLAAIPERSRLLCKVFPV